MNEETVLFRGSSSPVVRAGAFTLGGLVLIGSIAGAVLVSVWLLLLAGLAGVYLAVQWLLIRCRVYEVTTERVRMTNGILTRRTDELELYRVKDITLVESLAERLLGLGSIHMTTIDASTPTLQVESVQGARQLREDLRKSVEACRAKKGVRVAELE